MSADICGTRDDTLCPSELFEEAENIPSNPSANAPMGDVIMARLSRRDLMRGALAVSAMTATIAPLALAAAQPAKAQAAGIPRTFDFTEIAAGVDDKHHVAQGYDAQILIRWGDPVLPSAPTFDAGHLSAESQALQFGYNNDYLGYFPMPGASDPSAHGLLCVNHEYSSENLMFRRPLGADGKPAPASAWKTRAIAEVEMMAHGGSVLELRKDAGSWRVVGESKFARRITAETEMRIAGPAAGHDRMKTTADSSGTSVRGMLNNCAGGRTPWGTWLTCEENVNGYFSGKLADGHPEARNHRRMGVPSARYNWGSHFDRFDIGKEPNEVNRFGWVIEIDPFDPQSRPVKRTALGRFKHEGAAGIVNGDERYAVYSGDDQGFEYVYKFVTEGRFVPADRDANRDLLDRGVLSVARFDNDGTGMWLPLVFGEGPLTPANGFFSQADVVIEARTAADLLGATKMDRPEDVEANPKTGKVYVLLTSNVARKPEQADAANTRADNRFGHIIEIAPDGGDHGAARFKWDILVKCGDPSIAAVGATFNPATTKDGWFGMPDNCAFDADGRLWIATDGNSASRTGRTDGLWALETEGPARATSKLFFRCPIGAELCGPEFTPDGTTLFVAVQHPGEGGGSSFDKPSTRWPDFQNGVPPRPSILAITRQGGGKIAG